MKQMTVGKKISLACASIVVLTLVLGAVSLVSLGRISSVLDLIVHDSLPGLYSSSEMRATAKDVRVNMLMHIFSASQEEMAQLEGDLTSLDKQFRTSLKSYESTIHVARDREISAKVPPGHENVLRVWDKVRPLSRAKSAEALVLFRAEALPAMAELNNALNDLAQFNKANGEQNAKAAIHAVNTARYWMWAILLAALFAGSALAFFIVRGINAALKRTVNELSEGGDQVASAAGQVSSSSQSLAQGASEQAASLEETSASTEELTSMTRKNAEHTREVAELMRQMAKIVNDVNQALNSMVASMGEISGSSNKVSKIIKVIDEIAFQTNILALNAAVEAARAGEAGMGFAVVADEVRSLAQRSAQAAKDTAGLIEESIAKSQEGSRKLDQVTEAMRANNAIAGKIKTLVDEVHVGSEEQARGIEQIAKAVSQMEQVTQKTAATAEESASAAEEMNAQAENLKSVVYRLNALVGGAEAAPGRSRPPARVGTRGPDRDSLTALRKAVARNATGPSTPEPALAAVRQGHNHFPLDENFTEF